MDIAGAGSYRLDWLDSIGWIRLDNNGLIRTHSNFKYGMDGPDETDGTDGTDKTDEMDGTDGNDGLMDLMGRWWDWGGTDGC